MRSAEHFPRYGRTRARLRSLHAMAARNGVRARGVIDSAAEARQMGRAEASIADLFREAGVRVSPAKRARVPRFEHLKQLMVNGEFFVASRCRMWLATVPSLPRDSRVPDDATARPMTISSTRPATASRASPAACPPARVLAEARMPREERIVWV